MKRGFTMAEVLITIGVIGVVVALTLPSIIARIEDKVLESQSKKAQSVLANGFKLMMALEDVNEFGYTQIMACKNEKECVEKKIRRVFQIIADVKEDSKIVPETYKFTNGVERQVWLDNEDLIFSFITMDGMIFGIRSYIDDEKSLSIIADINGNKNPNRGGKDLCQYTMSNSGVIIAQCGIMGNYAPTTGEDSSDTGNNNDDDVPVIEDNELCSRPPSAWDNCHPLGFLSIFGTGRMTCGLCKKDYKLVVEGHDWAGNDYGYCVPKGCK